jgi:hypothetical protein
VACRLGSLDLSKIVCVAMCALLTLRHASGLRHHSQPPEG